MNENLVRFSDCESPAHTALEEMIRFKMQNVLNDILEEELCSFLEQMKGKKITGDKPAVVRNGYHHERIFETSVGAIKVKVPRTRDRSGDGETFSSVLVPSYKRRSVGLEEAISHLYLKGVSTNEIDGILQKLYGSEINGISPSSVTKLVRKWQSEQAEWSNRDLSEKEYCYIWVDGIHFNIRKSEDRACFYVIMGATKLGKKEVIAIENGHRESALSWEFALRKLKAQGMKAPKLAIGDGALGFWEAVKNIFPETREQLCWVHKTANVLDKLPKKLQPDAKKAVHNIYLAATKHDAEVALEKFYEIYKDKYPRATACLERVEDKLLTFYDFPAAHWQHIRATNPIESTFATVRLRTKSTRGNCNLETTKVMVYKLITEAQKNWRALNGSTLIFKVMKGVRFIDGEEEKIA